MKCALLRREPSKSLTVLLSIPINKLPYFLASIVTFCSKVIERLQHIFQDRIIQDFARSAIKVFMAKHLLLGRVSERMSCEEFKIIVYICRYSPKVLILPHNPAILYQRFKNWDFTYKSNGK